MNRSVLFFSTIAFVTLGSWTLAFVTELNLPVIPLAYSVTLPVHFLHKVPGPLLISTNGLDTTPAGNPMTNAGVNLGRVLFYDLNLSQNRTNIALRFHQD
jgi:hypothetical protein